MTKYAALMLVLAAGCTRGTGDDPRPPIRHPRSGAHHEGGRVGLHGMVLFGRATYFLEHIPTFSPPHDVQLVMRVSLATAEGAPIAQDFSDQGYSIRPTTQFSLDDLSLGKRVAFAGNIHRGNFEQGGPVLLANVKITIEQVLIARNLPNTDPIAADDQEYFIVGDGDDAYATNFIRDARGFQQILRIDAIEGVTPSPSRVLEVRMTSLRRLAPSATPTAGTVAKAGLPGATRVALAIGAELWCVKAPDFFEPCD